MFPPEGVSKAPCIVHEVAMTTPRTNTIGETLSKHDEHEDCPPVGSAQHTPGLDLDTLSALIEQLNGQYRAALSSAYCPSSDAHKAALRNVKATNAGIDAYIAAIARTTGANQ